MGQINVTPFMNAPESEILFFRLDCEKVRKGLGDSARELSNTLLKNVVDTYRKENHW